MDATAGLPPYFIFKIKSKLHPRPRLFNIEHLSARVQNGEMA